METFFSRELERLIAAVCEDELQLEGGVRGKSVCRREQNEDGDNVSAGRDIIPSIWYKYLSSFSWSGD